ncbi:MAG: MarR family transcriptional regulator [Alphaproteobacteria bacterium]|nr:MarR family transcriptional regulator [Alphaproteobacteria bacterium]MCB9793208.1 MarR family transcriptional regulator [Alphaproteobacteria bacterium]
MPDPALSRYIEDAGLLFDELGGSRMTGRVLAWLLTCEPPEQSSEQLAEALGVSRGSISMATQQLTRTGLIRRRTRPGSRALTFRLEQGAWVAMMASRLSSAARLRALADQGLEVIAPASPSQAARLEEMRDFYAFFESRVPELLQEWEAQRRPRQSM